MDVGIIEHGGGGGVVTSVIERSKLENLTSAHEKAFYLNDTSFKNRIKLRNGETVRYCLENFFWWGSDNFGYNLNFKFPAEEKKLV